ncbi:MAG TPA: DUF2393 family protein [Terriglobales bacterium]|jgi:hypothetical protein
MGGLIQSPQPQEPESRSRPILIGIVVVIVVVGIIALLGREQPKNTNGPPPYAANIKFSDLKMSAAENFVGASVTYLDGTVANVGDKTIGHGVVHIIFKDTMGQTAQIEDMPIRVMQTVGPYSDAVDLSSAPLGPGQSKPFRLTFEHVSAEWDRQAPELQITDVTLK